MSFSARNAIVVVVVDVVVLDHAIVIATCVAGPVIALVVDVVSWNASSEHTHMTSVFMPPLTGESTLQPL